MILNVHISNFLLIFTVTNLNATSVERHVVIEETMRHPLCSVFLLLVEN